MWQLSIQIFISARIDTGIKVVLNLLMGALKFKLKFNPTNQQLFFN